MATINSINLTGSGICKYDGAGAFSAVTVTQNALIYGGASNGLSSLALTNGQLAIGNTGNAPSAATLTQGSGITITNGAGTITIAATGSGFTWSVITADQTAATANGYICNKAGTLTITLPASPTAGDYFAVTGINTATGAKIAQNANQQIFFGTSSTTVGATGYIQSINIRDSATLVCVVGGSSAVWNVVNSVGNWTIV